MKGASGVVGGEIGKSTQAFFFVWTLLALGVTAMFSALLSAHALWKLPWRRKRVLPPEKHSTAKGMLTGRWILCRMQHGIQYHSTNSRSHAGILVEHRSN
jgi:hypothetical protein